MGDVDNWSQNFDCSCIDNKVKVAISTADNLHPEEQPYDNINIEHSKQDLKLFNTDNSFVDIEDEDGTDAKPENIEEHVSCNETSTYLTSGPPDKECTVNDYEQCGILKSIIIIVQRLADHASSLLFDVGRY
ncbi:hypothetical protein FQA39_LY09527 [Lamprigera yunnana]|nr:hypothetical protein FQA39_LY09527 [Lamprigera yunnana]